jgi:hypothetical protein
MIQVSQYWAERSDLGFIFLWLEYFFGNGKRFSSTEAYDAQAPRAKRGGNGYDRIFKHSFYMIKREVKGVKSLFLTREKKIKKGDSPLFLVGGRSKLF